MSAGGDCAALLASAGLSAGGEAVGWELAAEGFGGDSLSLGGATATPSERAAVQREIDRLQQLGTGADDRQIDVLLRKKNDLGLRIEQLT